MRLGPEIFDALAVLRNGEWPRCNTGSTASERTVTRAVDSAYSSAIEETLQNGTDEILVDYVRDSL